MAKNITSIPKLVIFDMDGLMFDSERLCYRGLSEVLLQECGYALPEDEYRKLIGLSNADFFSFYKNIIPDCDPEALDILSIAHIRELSRVEGIPIKTGLFELLDWLDTNSIKKVVATSTARGHASEMLKNADVYDRFDGIICGDEVTKSKPEPEIFLRAAQKGGAEPAQSLVLEDSANGIRASYAAGIPVIMIPDMIPLDESLEPMLAAHFDTLHDVIPFLESLR